MVEFASRLSRRVNSSGYWRLRASLSAFVYHEASLLLIPMLRRMAVLVRGGGSASMPLSPTSHRGRVAVPFHELISLLLRSRMQRYGNLPARIPCTDGARGPRIFAGAAAHGWRAWLGSAPDAHSSCTWRRKETHNACWRLRRITRLKARPVTQATHEKASSYWNGRRLPAIQLSCCRAALPDPDRTTPCPGFAADIGAATRTASNGKRDRSRADGADSTQPR